MRASFCLVRVVAILLAAGVPCASASSPTGWDPNGTTPTLAAIEAAAARAKAEQRRTPSCQAIEAIDGLLAIDIYMDDNVELDNARILRDFVLLPMPATEAEESGWRGCIDWKASEIRVDPRLGAHEQAEVLIHETLHGCLDLAGVDGRRLDEETVCKVIGRTLATVFRDNPELPVKLSLALNNGQPIVDGGALIRSPCLFDQYDTVRGL